jgi:hypothetical protein
MALLARVTILGEIATIDRICIDDYLADYAISDDEDVGEA